MKSKFSNDDSRFKIDDRFMEDDENDKTSKSNEKNENDNSDLNTSKKRLKNENLTSLKILEEITGKQLIRPKSMEDKESASKRLKNVPGSEVTKTKMVRYDPTKDSHKMFELKKDDEDETEEDYSSSDESIKKDDKEVKANAETNEKKEVVEDSSKYYKIEPNLKDLFSSNDVFKFKFTDENDKLEEEEYEEQEILKNEKQKSFMKNFDNFKKSKYSSSEGESGDEAESYQEKQKISTGFNRRLDTNRIINEISSFLPQFDQDTQIKDALVYFCRPKDTDLDNLRKEWMEKREALVKVFIFYFHQL